MPCHQLDGSLHICNFDNVDRSAPCLAQALRYAGLKPDQAAATLMRNIGKFMNLNLRKMFALDATSTSHAARPL
jgi:hypothetical protein